MAKQMPRIQKVCFALKTKTFPLLFKVFIIGLCVFSSSYYLVQAAICPSSVPSSSATIKEQCNFTGYSNVQTYGLVAGPVSSSLYYMYYLSALPNKVAVRKVDASGLQSWIASFNFYPILKCLSVDLAEQRLYLANIDSTILTVIRLSTSDGSVVSQHQFPTIKLGNHAVKTRPLADLSGFYVIGCDTSSPNIAKICKYTFSLSTAQCQTIANIKFGYGHLMLSSTQFFIVGTSLSTHPTLQMYKITFGSSSVNWANQIGCSLTSVCSASLSESEMSSDGSTIYSFFTYGATKYLYFAGLSATSGSVTTTRYKSNISVSFVRGSALNGDYMVATTYSPTSLIVFNIQSSTFVIMSFSGSDLNECTIEPSSGRYVVSGFSLSSGDGYTTKFLPQSAIVNSDFSIATWSMASLSAGTDDIIIQNGVTITAPDAPFAPATGAYTNQTVTYNQVVIVKFDPFLQTDTQLLSVTESTTSTIAPTLSCSFSGATWIVYTLESYNGANIPSFVQISALSGILSIAAPSVSNTADYSFYIDSAVSGVPSPVRKIVKLTVNKCTASNCQQCSPINSTVCVNCNSGYSLNSGSCILSESENSKILSIINQVVIGAILLLSLGFSLANLSSMEILWSVINQKQILFLLFLTGAFIPKDIEIIITGLTICLNPFSYLQLKFSDNYSFVSNYFDFGLENDNLENLGIKSDSTIVNMTSFILSLIIFCILHLCIVLIQKFLCNESKSNCCNHILSLTHWILKKLVVLFAFAMYIRIILETNQYILISCISEIHQFNILGIKRIISISIAFLTFSVSMAIILIIFLFALSKQSFQFSESQEKRNKFANLFEGVSLDKKSRLFVSLLLMRRAVFVIMLISIEPESSILVITLLIGLQLVYLGVLVFIRPYEEVKCNIVEIINEVYFTLLLAFLLKYNTVTDWIGTPTTVYTWFILSNSFAGFLIIFAAGVCKIVVKLKSKYCNKNEETIQPSIIQPVVASRIDNSVNFVDHTNVRNNQSNKQRFDPKERRAHKFDNKVFAKR